MFFSKWEMKSEELILNLFLVMISECVLLYLSCFWFSCRQYKRKDKTKSFGQGGVDKLLIPSLILMVEIVMWFQTLSGTSCIWYCGTPDDYSLNRVQILLKCVLNEKIYWKKCNTGGKKRNSRKQTGKDRKGFIKISPIFIKFEIWLL